MVAPANNPFGNVELEYPVKWTFRIIAYAEKSASVADEVQKIMARCKVVQPFALTSKSKEGTYQTMVFGAEISSRTEMEIIDSALKSVDGVKIVL